MQFLNKLYETREVAESLEGRTNSNEEEYVDDPAPLPPNETIRENPRPQGHKRRRQPDEVELKMIKALEESPPSPHISFIQGLLPHLDKFNDSEILEFQMGVLEVISKIKNKRTNTSQPQPLPPHFNYPFPQHQSFSSSQMSHSSAINSFQPQQAQTYESPNRQTHQFNNPRNHNNNYSKHQQACSSKGQPLEHRQEQTTTKYYEDFGQTSLSTSPETFPSASPSPAASVHSDTTTYDFSSY